MTTIYVYLSDEGVDVWRPVEAVKVTDQEYSIVTKNEHPDDERWQFQTGDVVRCEMRPFAETREAVECLVAIALARRA